jgi:zinc protease
MLKLLRRLALCLAPLTFLAPLAAQTLPAGVTAVRSVEGIDEYRLANGLQILLVPDDSKPSTTVNLTYRVGSRHENVGETGMAHLLEHMLFKGSPKHPQVWAEFTKRGLAANGSTSFDRTNYTASFSANEDNLRWYLGWLADSMVNSHIAREDLDSEMTVVRNEMESGENKPSRILIQRTMAAMHDWHPYGRAPSTSCTTSPTTPRSSSRASSTRHRCSSGWPTASARFPNPRARCRRCTRWTRCRTASAR